MPLSHRNPHVVLILILLGKEHRSRNDSEEHGAGEYSYDVLIDGVQYTVVEVVSEDRDVHFEVWTADGRWLNQDQVFHEFPSDREIWR